MDKLLKFYINGEWVDPISTDKMPVLNPASAEQVGEVALGNDADVDRAVAAAQAAYEHYSQTSKADRLALLGRIREVTERRFCLLYTSPSPRDGLLSRMPSSA